MASMPMAATKSLVMRHFSIRMCLVFLVFADLKRIHKAAMFPIAPNTKVTVMMRYPAVPYPCALALVVFPSKCMLLLESGLDYFHCHPKIDNCCLFIRVVMFVQ